MDYNTFVQTISDKYNYSEELKIAIRLTLPLMVEKYGVDKIQDICNLFENTRIFAVSDMGKDTRDRIERKMTSGVNEHVEFVEEDPYQNDKDPGSYYANVPVFDENANVIGERNWVVVKDMKDEYNASRYKELFGTSINMPYFIHEINHAFAMQNPVYIKEGNTINSKHGMFREQMQVEASNGKVKVTTTDTKNIIIEEGINEKYTQDMLTSLMKKQDYREVKQELNAINHVNTSYSPTLISLSEKLIDLLGDDKLYQYRNKNDMRVLKEFNETASKSEIAKTYCEGDKAFDYFDKKCFGIFTLASNCYKLPVPEYARRTRQLMVEAFSPLCAYQDISKGTMPKDKFDKIKDSILSTEIQIKTTPNQISK